MQPNIILHYTKEADLKKSLLGRPSSYVVSRRGNTYLYTFTHIKDQGNMLQKGTKAPDFTGLDENGNTIRLGDFAGRKLVLYFYPKDSTPGCTAEACDLRDNYERFLAAGYAVLGLTILFLFILLPLFTLNPIPKEYRDNDESSDPESESDVGGESK